VGGWDESKHPRDGDGQFTDKAGGDWADRLAAATPSLGGGADELGLAGRIELGPGERLVASKEVPTSHDESYSVVLALTSTPDGPVLRLGLVLSEDTRRWRAGNKGATLKLDADGMAELEQQLTQAAREAEDESYRQHGLYDRAEEQRQEELDRLAERKTALTRSRVQYDADGHPLPLRKMTEAELRESMEIHDRFEELKGSDPWEGLPDLTDSYYSGEVDGAWGTLHWSTWGGDMGPEDWSLMLEVNPDDWAAEEPIHLSPGDLSGLLHQLRTMIATSRAT
jgi:hypothetical protein